MSSANTNSADSYARYLNEVLKLVGMKNFRKAHEILSKLPTESKDPRILRARYTLSSPSDSPYYNEKDSLAYLDQLVDQSDHWGFTEKGKCFLRGKFVEVDTFLAEDMFSRSMQYDPEAKFYIAKIYADGLHKDGDEAVRDIDGAIRLYRELADKSDSEKYSPMAKFAYAEIVCEKAEPTKEELKTAFEYLLFLSENKNSAKSKIIFSRFLTKNIRKMLPHLFSWNASNATEHDMLSLDSRLKVCLSALDALDENIS